MRQAVIAILLVALAATTPSVRSSAQSERGLQPVVEHKTFASTAAEGWIEYPAANPRTLQHYALRLYLKVNRDIPLWCVSYADFKFSLRNASGQLLSPASPAQLAGAVVPAVSYGTVGPVGVCPYLHVLRRDSIFEILLGVLYPNLPPGAYTLNIIFAPKSNLISPTELPSMSFEVLR